MKIAVINGPNLNLVGKREPEIYGKQSLEEYFVQLEKGYPDHTFSFYQSNIEGKLIDHLQEAGASCDAIIINPGGYAHTSISIADAVAAITIPVLEIHISNVYAREEFRKTMLTAGNCIGVISGLGLDGYRLALDFFAKKQKL